MLKGPFASKPSPVHTWQLFYLPTDCYGLWWSSGSKWHGYTPFGAELFPPDIAKFSWVNQNASTLTQQGSGLTLHVPAQTDLNVTALVKPLDFTSNYTASLCVLAALGMSAGNQSFGLCLRDSATGRLVLYGIGTNAQDNLGPFAVRLDGPVTYHDTIMGVSPCYPANPIWLRVVDDGTNRRFHFSADGLQWLESLAQSRQDFFVPGQLGFWLNPTSGDAN